MDIFGFRPESVIARVRRSTDEVRFLTLAQSLLVGSTAFFLASMIVFGTVAFGERWMYRQFGLYGAYGVWAALFILVGGAALSLLIAGPARLARFYLLFGSAFFLYAAGWVAAYFTSPNIRGEWLGSLIGTVLMSLVIAWAFGAMKSFLKIAVVMFITHSAGYFLGSFFNVVLGGTFGMMMWGAAYGLGTGAGFGYALYEAQSPLRAMLTEQASARAQV